MAPSLNIKRQNHRIHLCANERKSDMLELLFKQYPDRPLLLMTSGPVEEITLPEIPANVTIKTDETLEASDQNSYDVLISYDLPEKALSYIKRLTTTKDIALILLSESDQPKQYPIEMLLGRTIMEEKVAGFETPQASTTLEKSKDIRPPKKGMSKPRRTSQRNHRYDGTPRTEEEKRARGQERSAHKNKKPYSKNNRDRSEKPKFDTKSQKSVDKNKELSDDKTNSKNVEPKRPKRIFKAKTTGKTPKK